MKLSRKGWNNVLIFAALLMILLFNLTSTIEKTESSSIPILPEDSKIKAIQLDTLLWENIDQQWHVTSSQQHLPSSVNIRSTVAQWQQQRLIEWPNPVGGVGDIMRIKVYLSQLASPIELSLFRLKHHWLISNWQGQLLVVEPQNYQQLIQPLMQQPQYDPAIKEQ